MDLVGAENIWEVNRVFASLSDCRWPTLNEKYLFALKRAADFILAEFPATVGIVACGSIVCGKPDPSSDLDIYVIHTAGFRQRVQAYFDGVPTEIFVNPPRAIEGYFRDEGRNARPITAHMLSTGYVVAATDPVVSAMIQKAREQLEKLPPVPEDLTQSRYMMAMLLEDALDASGRDRQTARMILSLAVEQLIRHAFAKAGRFQPRAKDLLKELNALDQNLGRLADRFFRCRRMKGQLRIASLIADKIIDAHGFFEWKSERQTLE